MVVVDEIQDHEKDNEAPIYGDILEGILSHVPLVDLVPASLASKSWSRAVISSLNYFNKPKPWLVIHSQSTRAPYKMTTHAYDLRSHVWVEISQPSVNYNSALRSSQSNFLYMISSSKLSFSRDPLNMRWHQVDAPPVWHMDPIIVMVEDTLIVAGGTCEFEDDPLAVEIYDVKSREWRTCESMPLTLKDSAASTWLSAAVVKDKLVVMEKSSGLTHLFDPKTQKWSEPFNLKPDPRIFYSVIGCSSGRLIMIGIMGSVENLEGVKIYEIINCENGNFLGEEIGEMPLDLMQKVRSEVFGVCNVNFCMAGDFVYVYNVAAVEEVVVGEMVKSGGCGGWRWWSLTNAAAVSDRSRVMERMVFSCAEVGLKELRRVMGGENRKFTVKSGELTQSS